MWFVDHDVCGCFLFIPLISFIWWRHGYWSLYHKGAFDSRAYIPFLITNVIYLPFHHFPLSLGAKHCFQSDIPTCEYHNNQPHVSPVYYELVQMMQTSQIYDKDLSLCFVYSFWSAKTNNWVLQHNPVLSVNLFSDVTVCLSQRWTRLKFDAWEQSKTII